VRASSVAGSVHPFTGPSWRAKISPSTATTEVAEPTLSNRWAACSREFGTDRPISATETRTSATGRAKSHRQVATSTSSADRYMPRMPPPPATAVQTPMPLDRSASGKVEVITARVTGMIIAAPTPARNREASITSDDSARPAVRFETPKMVRPASSTGLRPHRSPSAPSGRSKAARLIVYRLMNHSTSLCEASNSTASSGWATLRPVTEAITAISATQTAIRIVRR
jgi:hypothetical protein